MIYYEQKHRSCQKVKAGQKNLFGAYVFLSQRYHAYLSFAGFGWLVDDLKGYFQVLFIKSKIESLVTCHHASCCLLDMILCRGWGLIAT